MSFLNLKWRNLFKIILTSLIHIIHLLLVRTKKTYSLVLNVQIDLYLNKLFLYHVLNLNLKCLECYKHQLNFDKQMTLTSIKTNPLSSSNDSFNGSTNLPMKRKKIRKGNKKDCPSPKNFDSSATTSESRNQTQNCQKIDGNTSMKTVYLLIRDMVSQIRFQRDSYLACLMLLKELKFQGDMKFCQIMAASIISIVGKVHEYRPPSYKELQKWSKFNFFPSELQKAEAQILCMIGFQVPLLNSFNSYESFLLKVDSIDAQFSAIC